MISDCPISEHHTVKVYRGMGGKLSYNEPRRRMESYGSSLLFDYFTVAGKDLGAHWVRKLMDLRAILETVM
jgi:hypothetical protein